MSSEKVCSMCKQSKPLDAIGQNKKGEKIIVRSACKACTNQKKKEQRQQNPEKVKDILRRSYQKHREKRLDYARRRRNGLPSSAPSQAEGSKKNEE